MTTSGKTRRMRERLELQLPARVHCRESADHEWVELTRLLDVTPFGARFTLARPTERGRLLHLTMPLPRQLRCFDHIEEQYRVWVLVRHVKGASRAGASGAARFEVGVAFVGKHPPASYVSDPTKRYEPVEVSETGLYDLREEPARTKAGKDEPRPETRLNMPVDVVVEAFDEKGEVAMSEQTVTENISRRGAAIFTSFDLARGRFVRLTSKQYRIAVLAVVRARRAGGDGIPRLHLEFVDGEFPLEGL